MSNNIKQLRGQVRQIVKEILPEVLTQELVDAIYKQLQSSLTGQLEMLRANVNENLQQIDSRQKDISSMIMREVFAVRDRHVDQSIKPGESIASEETILDPNA